MPRYFFDFKIGGRSYRDRCGAEFIDTSELADELRELVLELARTDGLKSVDYVVTLRCEMKPVRKLQLRIVDEALD